jgi:outer membrane protein assembly factor BamB
VRIVPGVVALVLLCASTAFADDESVTYQVNTAHTGEASGSPLRPPLEIRWFRGDLAETSYPVIADGKVVVVAVEADDPVVVALDAETGQTVWKRSMPGIYTWGAVAYEAGRVFAINEDGVLLALDIDDGEELWSAQVPRFVDAPPTARDGLVYTSGGTSGGILYAIRTSDGSTAWTARVANGDNSSPAVDETSVYVSYACSEAYAFDRLTGARRWAHHTDCTGGGGFTPVLKDGRVYIREDYGPNFILSALDGSELGSYENTWSPPPAFAGPYLLRHGDGVLLGDGWTFAGDGQITSAPVTINGVSYVGSASGRIYGVDPATGRLLWQGFAGSSVPFPMDGSASQPLTGLGAGEGLLVVPTEDGVTAFQHAEEEPTPTPSPTPTATASPTATPTASPSPSPTATATASASPAPSPTATATASPSPSPGPSPTVEPTPSASASPAPTASASPAPSPSPIATASASASATPSPTATPSAGPTASATATPSAGPGPVASPAAVPTASATPTASPDSPGAPGLPATAAAYLEPVRIAPPERPPLLSRLRVTATKRTLTVRARLAAKARVDIRIRGRRVVRATKPAGAFTLKLKLTARTRRVRLVITSADERVTVARRLHG